MGDTTASRTDIARMYARAAFGATAADLDRWAGQPYQAAVDHLLNIPEPRPALPDDVIRLALEAGGRETQAPVRVSTIERAQRWWLERARTTLWPLLERMTLFWHDHFATGPGGPYPDVAMLLAQNETLRRNALGNFRTMCQQITVDPAMLYWLSGTESTARAPNENYGREFFELFTLGTIPQVYTETDIRESARCLTGWQIDPNIRIPAFSASRHDAGTKVVLGRTIGNRGAQEYLDIVDVALAQQPTAESFVAFKMVLNFAYPPTDTSDPLVAQVAATLRATGWNLKEAMRTLLSADAFRYAESALSRQVVRQPIDLVVSACKAIGVTADDATVPGLLTRMGQRAFDPPNVGGWPFGKDWLSPVTTLARYDWGVACYTIWNAVPAPIRPALPASGDLGAWAARFGLADLSANTSSSIGSYLSSRAGAAESEKQAGVLILLASSPDWMVM